MKLAELAHIADSNIEVKWNENLKIFQVNLFRAEIKNGNLYTATWGSGRTRHLAKQDYCKRIAGTILVFRPDGLTLKIPETIRA